MSAAPLSVVAVVDDGSRSECLVLNRPLKFIFEKVGNDYIGSDGPFRDPLYYQQGSGRFVAFAGRELHLTMADGTTKTVKDHWWSGGIKGYVSAAYSDVKSLQGCYVFYGGACIQPDDLRALRATYTGCIYPYRDYEKVVRFDSMRKDFCGRWLHEEGRRKALVQAVKAKHAELEALRAQLCGEPA